MFVDTALLISPRDLSGVGPSQERVRDERVERRLTNLLFEAEQPAGLRRRQPQAGHFRELRADTSHDEVEIHMYLNGDCWSP